MLLDLRVRAIVGGVCRLELVALGRGRAPKIGLLLQLRSARGKKGRARTPCVCSCKSLHLSLSLLRAATPKFIPLHSKIWLFNFISIISPTSNSSFSYKFGKNKSSR